MLFASSLSFKLQLNFGYSSWNFVRVAAFFKNSLLEFRQEFSTKKQLALHIWSLFRLFRTSIMMTLSSKSIFLFVKNRICLPLCKKETHSILLAFFHGQWTCDEVFFSKISQISNRFRQMGQIKFGIFGALSVELSAHSLSLCVPSRWFFINPPLLLPKTKLFKVRTFWEAYKIWKNLPHGLDIYLLK